MPLNHYDILTFLGLDTAEVLPPGNSAASMKNFFRHKTVGQLEPCDGYAPKFADGLPQSTNPSGGSYFKPAIYAISNIVYENIANLYVPEHGGKNVTILTMNYTKTGFFAASPTLANFGIWVRPYWNGSAWIDAWRELSEMFFFTLLSIDPIVQNRLYVGNAGTYDFSVIDPTGLVFNSSYFKWWTIAPPVQASIAYAPKLVVGCGFSGANYYLDVSDVNPSDYTSLVNGRLYVYRNFMYDVTPQTLQSYIFQLLNELRLTTGNGASDTSALIGFRSKTFTSDPSKPLLNVEYDQLILDTAVLNVFANTAHPESIAIVEWSGAAIVDDTLGLPASATGNYYGKLSLYMDDDNETELVNFSGTVTIATAPGHKYDLPFTVTRFYAVTTPRIAGVRIYISADNENWIYVKQVSFTDGTLNTDVDDSTATQNGTPIQINGNDYSNAPEATTQLGRSIDDNGVIQYQSAAVVNNTVYAVGIRTPEGLQPNIIASNADSGDGAIETDVFPDNNVSQLSVEYNDGDQLIGIANTGNNILALKLRSLVLITENNGVYIQQLVTKSVGCCSVRSICSWDDYIYFADLNGIWRYSTNGLELINGAFLQDWKNLSATVKQASIAVIDRENHLYRIFAGTQIYEFEITGSGQWIVEVPNDAPIRYALDVDGTIDFLTTGNIFDYQVGALMNSGNIALSYLSNPITFIAQAGQNPDVLLNQVFFKYISDVALTISVYLDGSVTPVMTVTLSSANQEQAFYLPLSCRCKKVQVGITGTKTDPAQVIQVKAMSMTYGLIPGGVSNQNVAR